MKTLIGFLVLTLFACGLAGMEINGTFNRRAEGWRLLRCRWDETTGRIEFRPGKEPYQQLAREEKNTIPPGSRVTLSASIRVDDPADAARRTAQLRLVFLNAQGQPVFAAGESGKATALSDTGKGAKVFECRYLAPENAASIRILVKSQAPVTMDVERIVLNIEPPEPSPGFPFTIRGIEPGSVADAGYLNHKPAGKFGFLKVKDGEFVFENGEKVRWFGINLVASRVFDCKTHQEADALAAKLAALGVNMVRLHHLAPSWQREEPLFADGRKSTFEFNDRALEKLDYLLFALKKQGIYVTDEIIDASLHPADGETPYPAKTFSDHTLKIEMMFDPAVQAYVKKWFRAFFCRPNRYTGVPLIKDPQLALLGIVNEASIGYHNGGLPKTLPPEAQEKLAALYRAQFPGREFDFMLNEESSVRFFHRLLSGALGEWRDFLKQEGYRGLVSGSNFGENFYAHTASAGMDFMDAHLYWGFAGYMDGVDAKTRILPGNRWSDLVKPPRNENRYTKELFARFSLSSTPDMPLISSEHRSSIQNFERSAYRTAGLPFFAAIHAFQEWDGFYIFASQGGNENRIGHRLDVKFDTAYLALFPVSSLILRGGVVAPAREGVLYEVSDADVFARPNAPGFMNDGLFHMPERHRVRLLYPGKTADRSRYRTVVPLSRHRQMPLPEPLPPVIGGDTGEFERNWEQGTFRLNTARVQGVEGFFEPGSRYEFTDSVLLPGSPYGVYWLSAGCERSIGGAKRLLFTAVNTAVNSGKLDKAKSQWGLPGLAPVRVLPVQGVLEMKHHQYDVWALDENGARREMVARQVSRFAFDTGRDRTVWYELEKR